MLYFYSIGVIVNWEQTQYFPTEGSVFSICALQLEPTEREFNIDVSTPTTQGIVKLTVCIITYIYKEGLY